ncbi:PPE domain-containing protein [[Mycobacterium] holstebronense]|uniref:PPE domain-containing protein n=1 Tax=[Mycobacterium] holstebronense TaxID=3064288 RepID=A0ABM9LVC3_9MYCO|nr:PPE domain-containing protein [Mycolicibacter sp. MU0102]CAJ1505347.1 PPE domain-containing protein [Mycolicibacter sp. MU0102]
MTAPAWMALPPEVHSTMLTSGPGPGSVLAAAGTWKTLSAEYSSAAVELSEVLAAVQAGAWQGPSAATYVAANAPYLAWLSQASADSAAAAAQHEAVAAAYVTALAAMPTMAELATNHAVHGLLLATNFFGVNTVPIAINEADYARMWVQAATTMSTYQAVASVAAASIPPTASAPAILKSEAPAAPADSSDPWGPAHVWNDPFLENVADVVRSVFGLNWDPVTGTIDGLPYTAYTNPLTVAYWLKNTLTQIQEIDYIVANLSTNPEVGLLLLNPVTLAPWLLAHPLTAIELGAAISSSLAAPLASMSALAALAALPRSSDLSFLVDTTPQVVAAPSGSATTGSNVHVVSVAGSVPAGGSPAAAPPASVPGGASPPAPPAPAPAPAIAFPYMIGFGGGPGTGFNTNNRTGSGTGSQAKSPASDSAVEESAARRASRSRRRRRAQIREHGEQYADMNVEVDAEWGGGPIASQGSAGGIGFGGNAVKHGVREAGLATLAGDSFNGIPSEPLLPASWTGQSTEGVDRNAES